MSQCRCANISLELFLVLLTFYNPAQNGIRCRGKSARKLQPDVSVFRCLCFPSPSQCVIYIFRYSALRTAPSPSLFSPSANSIPILILSFFALHWLPSSSFPTARLPTSLRLIFHAFTPTPTTRSFVTRLGTTFC